MSNYFIPEKDVVNTILEEGTIFNGDLSFSSSIEIRGEFKGVIRSKGLVVIAKTALVEASIFTSNIVIKGTVRGDILAFNKLEIEEDGQVYGNIKTYKIKVTDGVIFEGDCATLQQSELEKEFKDATQDIFSDEPSLVDETQDTVDTQKKANSIELSEEKASVDNKEEENKEQIVPAQQKKKK